MFDLLKKKLSSFADKLKKKTEEKPIQPVGQEQPPQKPIQEPIPRPEPISEKSIEPKPVQQEPVRPKPRVVKEPEKTPMPAPKPSPVQTVPKPEPNSGVSDLLRSSIGSVRDELVKEHEFEEAKQKITPKQARPPDAVKPFPEKPPAEKQLVEKPPVDMTKVEQVKDKVSSPAPVPEKKPELKTVQPKPKPEQKQKLEPKPKQEPKKSDEFKLKSFSEFLDGKPQEQELVQNEKPVSMGEQEASLKKLSDQLNAIKEEESKKKISGQKPISREKLLMKREKPVIDGDKRELKSKVGAFGLLKGAIKGHIELKEADISELLFELELSLLEADVNQETAKALISKIKEHLLKEKIPRGKSIDAFLKNKIKQALTELTHTEKINILKEIDAKQEKPFRILFLGPNGAGKTTTIAKLTFALRSLGKSVLWAASDTFRAASIEQLEEHAKKLNIRVVKHSYGADPTAVAFDAVKAAQASHIEVVIIDSAGRQETNRNLIEELKKLERVIKPDLKIFVGETYSGKGLIDTARSFDEAIGIDAFILTKIDTDPKGGTVISLLYELKKPVLFIGTGQRYEDLTPFTPSFIIDRII